MNNEDSFHLEDWFATDVLEKLSEKQVSFNARVVEISGHLLCYYSQVPPYFHEKKELRLTKPPKQGVQIANILSIEHDDENTRTRGRPNVFKITFQKRHLIQFKNSQREAQVFRENYTRNYTSEDAEVILDSSRPLNQGVVSKFGSRGGGVQQQKTISKEPLIVWVFQCRSMKVRDEWETRIRVLRDYYLAANIESELERNQQILRKQFEKNKQQQLQQRFKDTPGQYGRKPQLDSIVEEIREEKNTANSLENKNLGSFESNEQINLPNLANLAGSPSIENVQTATTPEEQAIQSEKRNQMRMMSMNGAFESMLSMSSTTDTGEHPDFQNKLKSKMYTTDADLDEIKEDELNLDEKPTMTEEEQQTAKLKKEKETAEQIERNQQVCNSVYELRYTNFIGDQVFELKNGQQRQQQQERDSEIALKLIGSASESSMDVAAGGGGVGAGAAAASVSAFNAELNSSTLDFDEKFRLDMAPLELIGQFNNDAQEATKALIDDLLVFGSQKKYFPTQIENQFNLQRRSSVLNMESAQGIPSSNFAGIDALEWMEMLPGYEFRIQHKPLNDFVIKLSWIAQEEIEVSTQADASLDAYENYSPNLEIETFEAYTNFHGKALSAEFKALNLINTEHIRHKAQWNQWIKVPLSCIVTYKGFKALVQANPPDEDGLVHGPIFNSERNYEGYKVLPQIEQQLQSLGKRLGIKPHTFKNGSNPKCQVYLCFVTEVHKGKRFQKIKQLIKDEPGIQNSVAFSQETYYLKNVGDIFPVNENYLSQGGMFSKTVQFRQEYLATLRKQLNPDAFEDEDPESQSDAEAIGQASLYLEEVSVKAFVRDLDALKLNVIDSFTLREAMHRAGINMKYLGEITKQTQIPFLMNLGIVDMIARAIKKILNSTIAGFYLKSKQWINQNVEGSQTTRNINTDTSRQNPSFNSPINRMQTFGQQQNQSKDARVRQVEEMTRDAIIDILNMLFSRDEESQVFHDILNQQINYDFNFDRAIEISSVKQGQLLASVCFHCDLSLTYSADIFTNYEKKLASVQKFINDARSQRRLEDIQNISLQQITIFSREHFVEHYVTSNVFSMDTLGIMQFINNNNQIDCSYPLEARIAAIQQSLNVKKLTNTLTPISHLFHLSELARLYFEASQFTNAAKIANDAILLCTKKIDEEIVIVPDCQLVCAMMVLIKISFKNNITEDLRSQTTIATQNVLKILKFLVDDNHPLFYELTSLFIKDKVGKKDVSFDNLKRVMESEMLGFIRALGPNHPRIAERYKAFADYSFEYDRTAPIALTYYEKAFSIFSEMEQTDSTVYSIAECCYSMSLIFYYKNQMDLCRKFLEGALKEFKKRSDDIERVSKLLLLRCYLNKQGGSLKAIIQECEDTWKFLDSNPFGQMKLIGCYKELILIYVEIIAGSWNRNLKIQFNQFTGKIKKLISDNIQIPTNVRKCFLKIPLAVTSIDSIFVKKTQPVINRLIEDDSAAEAQLKLFQEKRLQLLIKVISESEVEVWRFIEKQFLIIGQLSNQKIDALYSSRESLQILSNTSNPENFYSDDQIYESSLNFFETLVIVFGYMQMQKIFCEF